MYRRRVKERKKERKKETVNWKTEKKKKNLRNIK